MEKLPSALIHKLPLTLKQVENENGYYTLFDTHGQRYHLYPFNVKQMLTYMEISKSKHIQKSIFETKHNQMYYLLFSTPHHDSEDMAAVKKMIEILESVFQEFSFSITLKKEHIPNLNHTYKLLDNKFTYFEMRIREIEVMPRKDDIAWVMLSKYNIILDAKVYLYDLQQDIFHLIDKNTVIDYGIVFPNIKKQGLYQNKIEPSGVPYYGPIGMMYARLYLSFDHIHILEIFHERIKKLDKFNQKYFCFMCIYIYILNLNLDVLLNPYNVSNYLQITKKIKEFLKEFSDYVKK